MASSPRYLLLTLSLAALLGAWCLLFTLGHAPDVDTIFEDAQTRAMARQFMELSDAAGNER